MLSIGYGEGSFENLRNRGDLYIDKTQYIPLMENISKFFFIRPRRFGKSLFLSMLKSYYNINEKDKFDTLFDGLYIQKNPTKLKNTYLILYLNFSGIRGGSEQELKKDFDESVKLYIDGFFKDYRRYFPEKDVLKKYRDISKDLSASSSIAFLLNEARDIDHKIYVLIDEYDQFINTIVSEGLEVANLFVSRKAGKEGEKTGFVRHFFEKLKIGSDSNIFERFFITGVSPIMLDELASGFNIMTNMTTNKRFNEMLGFTQKEVISILDRISEERYLETPKEQVLNDLIHYYNGYRFSSQATETLFNSDMILYFVQQFQSHSYPEEILDLNVKTDYEKLQGLIIGLSDEDSFREILEEINLTDEISFELKQRFTFAHRFNSDELKSLLFYLGLLTCTTELSTFKIPNQVIRVLYWEYLQHFLEDRKKIKFNTNLLHSSVREMYKEGKVESLRKLVDNFYREKLSNYDFSNHSEKHVKFMLVSYFTMTSVFNIVSERELPGGSRIDLLYEGNPAYEKQIKYHFIIELKYINKEKESKEQSIKEDAIQQVALYHKIYTQHFQKPNKKTRAIVIIVKYNRETELIEVV